MKIAASDFDGTLFHKEAGISQEDLQAIRKWQAVGNKFGLVTGRNMHLARLNLDDFELKLDFFVGLNGAVIFDEREQEIFSDEMPPEAVKALWQHEIARESPYVMTLRGKDTFARWRDKSCWDPPLHDNIPEIPQEEAQNLPHVLQMCFSAPTAKKAAELAADVSRHFAGQLSAEANLHYVDVCAAGNTKATGLARLQEIMDWQKFPLCVIGDDLNDLSMIERFQGFAMAGGNPLVKEKASGIFDSVGKMLEANL
ncbi:MAG: HAD-IIB family hydrolase [Selenomonas sp.]|nr:HAD-IIB family hydrolase [Selenomonas sp.]